MTTARSIPGDPRRQARRCALIWALPLAALLQACVTPGERASPAADLDLIAQNLVFSLAQIEPLNPLATTVQLSRPTTPFGREVVRRIRDAGYGLQNVEGDRGERFLRYRVQEVSSETGEETRYVIALGDISIERAFDVIGGRTVPTSDQTVRGATAVPVTLNDDLFGAEPADLGSDIVFQDGAGPVLEDLTVGNDVAGAGFGTGPARVGANDNAFRARLKENLYDGPSSNFENLFADYRDIDQATLEFENDSLRLGDALKATVADYAARVDPDTDLLSVVGCSHGNTAIDNGNSVLALGRANRVKEALVFAGVPPSIVLDEGCWASGFHKVFPKRGVVLTLKRRS